MSIPLRAITNEDVRASVALKRVKSQSGGLTYWAAMDYLKKIGENKDARTS